MDPLLVSPAVAEREPTLAEFVARSQVVARWIHAARDALDARVPIAGDQFQEAVLWLAATGVVPVVPAGPARFVPNFAPERIVVRDDAKLGAERRTVGYAANGGTEPHPVVCWIAPVLADDIRFGGAAVHFMTPIAALHREVADAERRYRAVETAAALRLNAPLMFGRAPSNVPLDDVGTTPADAMTPRRRSAAVHTPYMPYYPGAAPNGVHRLYHGATYRHMRDNLLRPYEALPPFDAAHARGMARALTSAIAALGARATVRPRPVPAPAAKRRRPDPGDSESDSGSEAENES